MTKVLGQTAREKDRQDAPGPPVRDCADEPARTCRSDMPPSPAVTIKQCSIRICWSGITETTRLTSPDIQNDRPGCLLWRNGLRRRKYQAGAAGSRAVTDRLFGASGEFQLPTWLRRRAAFFVLGTASRWAASRIHS
jgi:hypothetical protein